MEVAKQGEQGASGIANLKGWDPSAQQVRNFAIHRDMVNGPLTVLLWVSILDSGRLRCSTWN